MTDSTPHAGQDETLRRMASADNYNAWLFARSRPYLGRSVLDAGAGLGTFTELAAADGRRVFAAEPDPEFVRVLEDRFGPDPNVAVLAEEAAVVELPEPVDAVLCFNVLEHISDDAEALGHFRELLAPGGHLLLLVPAHAALFGAVDRAVGHERRYGKAPLAALLTAAGFEVVDLRHVNPVGAIGWLVSSRVLGSKDIPKGPLRLYDRLVPALRALDWMRFPFGLSLWAVARKPPHL